MSDSMPSCFAIMPISDPEGYEKGHFRDVYEDLIKPACEEAGFQAIRGDEVKETNLIHLDILKKLLEAPMAICDLSSRNPNVLFELGIRQAFDKPVVLIQEEGTPRIFDIAPLRALDYSKDLKYRNVIENRKSLTASLKATDKAQNEPNNINSLVKLLGLGVSASIPEIKDGKTNLQLEYITKQLEQVTAKLPTIESTSQSIFSDQIHNELLTASNLDDKVAIQVFRNELNLILSLPASYTDKIESLENLEERISKRLDQNKSGTRISRITLLKRIKDEIQNLQT